MSPRRGAPGRHGSTPPRARAQPRPGAAPKTSGAADRALEPVAWGLLVAWAAALLLAAPDSTAMWGLNGMRSVPRAWGWLLAAAAAVAALGAWRPRAPWAWGVVGAALAVGVAFPLREQIHLLGDTQLRLRALFAAGAAGEGGFAPWWARLHANPLDILVDAMAPLSLHAMGWKVVDSVSAVTAVLGLAYGLVAWRLAGRLDVGERLRGPLALAIVLSGLLEAFAGYADSAALVAVVALGWWAEILAPLDRPARAWRAAVWFAALLLSHRMAAVMVLPQLARALGPPLAGDRPAARGWLVGLTGAAVALAILGATASGAMTQLATDARELARSARGFAPRPLEVLNALVVVAPLALAAPFLAGRRTAGLLRDPRLLWVAAAALPLLVALVWVFPVGESGLGAHRDWDTNVLLGVSLTVGGAAWLAAAGEPRLGRTLPFVLPLLALTGLGWVAVNADVAVAMRRAIALAESPTALTEPQRAHLFLYFGQRAMDERRPDVAARHYERAFELAGNPRRALLAAEAWLFAGEPRAARAALARARGAGPLSPELERSARAIESRLVPGDGAPAP